MIIIIRICCCEMVNQQNGKPTKVIWPTKQPWPDTRSKYLITSSLLSFLVKGLSQILSVQMLWLGLVECRLLLLTLNKVTS